MIFENFEINASPFFSKAVCPIHRNSMIELDDGWFSKTWYCEECKTPYTLKLVKLRKYNKENLDKLLKDKWGKK